jgi:hypothetical protein
MGVDHFSMKDILKVEKESGKKKRKRTKKNKRPEGMEREVELGKEGWKIDTKDPRFKALHEEGDFAIDPSNPQYVPTPCRLAARRLGLSSPEYNADRVALSRPRR